MQTPVPPPPWSTTEPDFANGSILMGNGASLAVWERFGYESLWERARDGIAHPLNSSDQELFAAFDTRNFERVLAALDTSQKVNRATGFNTAATDQIQRYEHIQRALAEAVRYAHVPWARVQGTSVLAEMTSALHGYSTIYSTNYDLLLYWATMSAKPPAIDYLWNGNGTSRSFDLTNVEKHDPERTDVFYLHGALHLFVRRTGATHKRINSSQGTLLEQFGDPLQPGDIPLIITEGDSATKEESIRSSDYLSFAHETLANDTSPLVVFGHRLDDESDRHLVKAINAWIQKNPARPVAVSVHVEGDWVSWRDALKPRLKTLDLRFFDAATHPLGSSTLRIPVTA